MIPRLRRAALILAIVLAAGPAAALQVLGLGDDNRLVVFDTGRPVVTARIALSGVEGRLLGIDFRPADGKLYGVSERGTIYTIDPRSGAATAVATLTQGFAAAPKPVVDFNPQADRLRLINVAGTSFRVVPETGAVTVDGTLRFAEGDRHHGVRPTVTAGAYTNAFAGARGTELFNIDTALDVLVLQSPPNDGVLQSRGRLGIDFSPTTAFDIVPTADGGNRAFAVSRRVLYGIDLESGRARRIAAIARLGTDLIDIAIVPPRR
ncbi:MAG: DUF4394 domain-containing protein [Alphaproteobacteria bacterium]|nr:DUF4394 domain-containing protein [Alphaproteobacteria bacterium]